MKKIKVAAVRYLNTRPLLYGIRNHEVMKDISLVEEYPARIAEMLVDDKVDLGLVPVAIIPKLKEHHIITDFCIGADGAVASVCLFSESPVEQLEEIYLDYQSHTSVNLARILLREYWKVDVRFIDATGEDFRDHIRGRAGGVIIGDRAFEQRRRSRYIYDLGAAWKDHTGLPFVFAAWISNKALPQTFISSFNEANRQGLHSIDQVVAETPYPLFDLREYYTKCISYRLDEEKQKGLKLFLEKLQSLYQKDSRLL